MIAIVFTESDFGQVFKEFEFGKMQKEYRKCVISFDTYTLKIFNPAT